jgi:hypothetical protein
MDAQQRVAWPVFALVGASTCVVVGIVWDISWHQTIGRDTFWTPAHVLVYLGATLAGLTGGWLALRITFAGTPGQRAESVWFWGFRAPLGAWVAIWGALAMLTSAPFDDWWHNAYGLDVRVLSPPHAVLASGIAAIQTGAMLMVLAVQNRAGRRGGRLQWLFLVAAALLVVNAGTLVTEFIRRWDMHRSAFYQVVCFVFPFLFVGVARASATRWGATLTAAIYTAVVTAMVWILPLFEGRPLLGPIYVQVERFVPPEPALLLVAPAVAVDLLLRHWTGSDWWLAAVVGVVFLTIVLAVQWPFAEFLMSPWARNWIFGTHHVPYAVPPIVQEHWFQLNDPDNLSRGLLLAAVLAYSSARGGLWWGKWMSLVQR